MFREHTRIFIPDQAETLSASTTLDEGSTTTGSIALRIAITWS
jgi:hypothetical protein